MRRTKAENDLIDMLATLASAVHEQQYTLNSAGWMRKNGITWSKAGARHHQYIRIEELLAEVNGMLDDSITKAPKRARRKKHGK